MGVIISLMVTLFAVSQTAIAEYSNRGVLEEPKQIEQDLVVEETVQSIIVRVEDASEIELPYETEAVVIADNAKENGLEGEEEHFVEVQIPEGVETKDFMNELKDIDGVVTAEPERRRQLATLPNDPQLEYQWHIDGQYGMQVDDAWDTRTGAADIVVAVIDSGIDIDHTDLADNLWTNSGETAGNGIDDDGNGYIDDVYGWDFYNNDNDPDPEPNGIDDDGDGYTDYIVDHGTHVAGIIGAVGNNSVGVSGVAQNVQLMNLQIFDDEGDGGYSTDIANAIEYAVDNGAHIINMSLGGYFSDSLESAAIEYANENGVVVLAAAGNESTNVNTSSIYPGCYDNVLAVAATTEDGEAADFSNFGANCVDIAAPGEFIYATYVDVNTSITTDDYGYMSGTSMATPAAAGAIALLLAEDDSLTPAQVEEIIEDNSDDIGIGAKYGSGLVNIDAALAQIESTDGNSGEDSDNSSNDTVTERPTAPTSINAYTDSSKGTSVSESTRTLQDTPYFTWSGASDSQGSVVGYYVYFGTNVSANPETAGTYQTATNYQATSISGNDQSYYLKVQAVDDEDNVSSDVESFEYIIDDEVSEPTIKKTELTSNGIRIRWEALSGEHVSKYRLYRKVGNKSWKKIKVLNSSKTKYIDKTVKPGKKYTYKLKAVDDLGTKSGYSNTKKRRFYPRERVVVAPGPGASPLIRIYNMKTFEYERSWYAFDENDGSGVELAVGQFDSDRKHEIVIGKATGGPEVYVYEAKGTLKTVFLAYDPNFTGGVRVSTADVDADGIDEIVTVPGEGGSPQVKVWEPDGTLKYAFNALDSSFTGGAFVAGVDWNGNGKDEIAVAAGIGDGRRVTIYKAHDGSEVVSFDAYGDGFNNGLRISSFLRSDNNDKEGVAVVPAQGSAHVLIYKKDGSGASTINTGFFPFLTSYTAGATIAGGDVTQKDADRVIISSNGSAVGTVVVYTKNGTLKRTIRPFGRSYTGPVRVASGWVF